MICNSAIDGGKNGTIAAALGIPVNTLTNRFGKLLKQYRAFRKLTLCKNQTRLSVTSADMAKFLGINELGQQIKQVIETVPVDSKPKTGQELAAARAAARAYNESMSKTEPDPPTIKFKG